METDRLSPTKQALLALKQMQRKLEALENAKHEPIAVVGMGCRFPGADSPQAFWELLINGKEAITQVPLEHWDVSQYRDKIASDRGGFVPHLKEFDAPFFRIAPREAISLDPQQRLLLEVSWEALENAGIAADRIIGSQTGVFIGICGTDYWHQLLSSKAIDAYLTTGNTHSLASGRLSHFYGFTGASISLDTACSSSLVAVHLAIKSLRDRECNMALAGGVNRLISPQTSINFTEAKMLSAHGCCRTFDRDANGFVRSEGCGVVVLKRLNDAIAEGDNILAVLLGSAVNQDGRTSSITTPSSLSQQEVIYQALANARIEPERLSYLETHGTGTSLGDLIEVEALSSVFGEEVRSQPLVLGAVKTNIGHLEGASGIASLIKVVLALQNQQIPANLNLERHNDRVNWQNLPFTLPNRSLSWQCTAQSRIAGVSAFGFSGTNSHVIVSETPKIESSSEIRLGIVDRETGRQRDEEKSKFYPTKPLQIFTLSARSKPALQQLAANYASYLQQHFDLLLEDICFTANTGRSHFNYRLAVVAASTAELQAKLAQFTTQQQPAELWQGKANTNYEPQICLILEDDSGFKKLYSIHPLLKRVLECFSWQYSNNSADIYLKIDNKSNLESARSQVVSIDLEADEWQQITFALAQLYVLGVVIDWQTWERDYSHKKIILPTYPFQRQKYWLD